MTYYVNVYPFFPFTCVVAGVGIGMCSVAALRAIWRRKGHSAVKYDDDIDREEVGK